jgi:drug/metabolite transporter (DMT)-like permease
MSTKILILLVTINMVIGQLFLKRALIALGGAAALADLPRFIWDAVRSPWIYTSLAIQGLGYFLWMILLTRVKLGVATASAGAGCYILTALLAWAIYGENLSPAQWVGVGLITAGVVCVSMSPL